MIRCALALTFRPLTSTPRARRPSSSSVSTRGSTTTPLPMMHVLPGERIPLGTRWNANFSSPLTIVWPALLPPWKRTTTSACSARRSTTLPLPSSPHWAPTITVLVFFFESGGGEKPLRRALQAQEARVLALERQRDLAEAAVAVL